LGINGKISELQAAMGLSVLPNFIEIVNARKQIVNLYLDRLQSPLLSHLKLREDTEWNYSYFPVLFPNEEILLIVQEALNQEKIFPRRYFYPSLNRVEFIQGREMPTSENISSRILCLPLYFGLGHRIAEKICAIINLQIAK
jgi:dTDP-4-amino-4,6-dideoxygalactose transaminase